MGPSRRAPERRRFHLQRLLTITITSSKFFSHRKPSQTPYPSPPTFRRRMSVSRPVATKLSQLRPLCTAAASEVKLAPKSSTGLYQKLAALGATGGSVFNTLNEHIMEGNVVNKLDMMRSVKELRKYRRPDHALQVMEWMENRNINFSFRDYALRLDLISKVKGVAETERYFHNLPTSAKNKYTYGALLNCYCSEAMEQKALSLFKEMEGLGFASYALPYNNIMGLYLRISKLEKIPSLVEEMKRKSISLTSFTYNVLMQSYARLDDIEGVERVYQEILKDDATLCDWTTYSNLAAHYFKAGLNEKAESALKNLESVMDSSNREAYHYLITMYTNLSNLVEVHRVWDSLKAAFRITTNISYLVMLGSLRKLKDLEGIKKVFEEWDSKCSRYDTRLVKIVIRAYLEKDRLEEAETMFKHASTKASKPLLSSMELFMVYFLKRGMVDRCVEFLEAAVSKSKDDAWTPYVSTIDAFLMHFQGNGDLETANQMFNLLKDVDNLKGIAYHLLLTAYVAAGKTDLEMRRMLEEDGIEIGDELEKLLQKVCPS